MRTTLPAILGMALAAAAALRPASPAGAAEKPPAKPATKSVQTAHKLDAKVTTTDPRTGKKVTRTVKLAYLLYLPDGYEKAAEKGTQRWPLMLFLHGAGERGTDLSRVKIHGPPKLVERGKSFPFLVVSPQCPRRQWWDVDALIALLDEIAAKYRVDPDRLYVTGLSMGGFGTWALAAKAPKRFAALVPICGGGNPKAAARLKDIPTWVFHGGKDGVVPPRKAREMVEAIQAAGGKKIELTVYPNAGHDSWTKTYDNPALYEWMLKHTRKAPAATKATKKKARSPRR